MADAKLLSDALDVLWNHANESAKAHSFVAISKLILVTGYDADTSYVDQISGLGDWEGVNSTGYRRRGLLGCPS